MTLDIKINCLRCGKPIKSSLGEIATCCDDLYKMLELEKCFCCKLDIIKIDLFYMNYLKSRTEYICSASNNRFCCGIRYYELGNRMFGETLINKEGVFILGSLHYAKIVSIFLEEEILAGADAAKLFELNEADRNMALEKIMLLL